MGKNPAFLFYPGDWVQDTRILSLRAKGAWIDLLCMMWRSTERGTVTLSWPALARLLSAHLDEAKLAIEELAEHRICDWVTDSNGNVTLINRRMVREEKQRISTRLRVKRLRNAECNAECNADVTLHSSVSVTDSVTKQKKETDKSVSSASEKSTDVEAVEWPEDVIAQELLNFLRAQKYFPTYPQGHLLAYRWWDNVSQIVGGIDIVWIEKEFAKMSNWIYHEKPHKKPTPKGLMRFIRSWLERAYEKERCRPR
ncbi:MAG: hypothetical protein IT393_07200 [Nitrospirae bacterium]|nr:hypothetical protein [Nitrospirota bacterium]